MINLLIYILSSFLLLIIFIKSKSFTFLNFDKRNEVQQIHYGVVPRIGGLFLYIQFLFGSILFDSVYLYEILIYFLPILILMLIEDSFFSMRPSIRLFLTFIFLYFFLSNSNILEFPFIETPFLSFVNDNIFFQKIFFTFALLGLMNGTNLIDGVNGLCVSTFIIQIICLISYAYYFELSLSNYFFLLIPTFIFLFFNYPWGKIFLGDSGAYLLGYISGLVSISFFSKHPEISTYYALTILCYPIIEMFFSFFRKTFVNRTHPFSSDEFHLHLIVYKFFLRISNNSLLANNLVLPFLMSIVLSPVSFLFFFPYINSFYSFFVFFGIFIFYLMVYIFLRKYLNK